MPEPTQADTAAILPADKPNQAQAPMFRPARKSAGKPAGQASVAADCPYCNQKHEIPVEKGRSGKPFFQSCTKCKNDFAVRFVQVSMYQAQVAGFR